MRTKVFIPLFAIIFSLQFSQSWAACGGSERWAIKVGSDADAQSIDLSASPVEITVTQLNQKAPTAPIKTSTTRQDDEEVVYKVHGHLVFFVKEADQDFHLVITDDTLNYAPGGQGAVPTGHSFIAEIPNPDCVPGAHGDPSTTSYFADKLKTVRDKFEAKFPGMNTQNHIDIPVTITGVLFFDMAHTNRQVGRTAHDVEIHPILNISFDDEPGVPTDNNVNGGGSRQILTNPGFENGDAGWDGTGDLVYNNSPHSGTKGAWLGGLGEAHTDILYQKVALAPAISTATLTYWIHIETDETTTTKKYDTLSVQVRDEQGGILRNLKSYSNLNQNSGYKKESFDLSDLKGQQIKIYFEATEDQGKLTSFYIDDVEINVQ